jgi:hypothetical protein
MNDVIIISLAFFIWLSTREFPSHIVLVAWHSLSIVFPRTTVKFRSCQGFSQGLHEAFYLNVALWPFGSRELRLPLFQGQLDSVNAIFAFEKGRTPWTAKILSSFGITVEVIISWIGQFRPREIENVELQQQEGILVDDRCRSRVVKQMKT